MIQFLICGFGFMGRMHASLLRSIPEAGLAGVVDPRGEGIRDGLVKSGWERTPVFVELASALGVCKPDAVMICLPTDLHRAAAETAFAAGCDVFCEKPVALTVEDAAAMTHVAERAGRQLMVGHCIRFWPEYEVLKRVVDSGEHGRLVSLSLSRRNTHPEYAVGGWVNDPARCVGAALDMHIHDTDFICHLLGEPRAVSARGIRESTGWNSIVTTYDFGPEGPLVFADGAWNYPAGWGFQMRFSAVLERAALDFDSRANPSLMITEGSNAAVPMLLPEPATDGYRRELEYFIHCVANKLPVEMSTGGQATRSLAVTIAEIESASAGGQPISITNPTSTTN